MSDTPNLMALQLAHHLMTCKDVMVWRPDPKMELDWVDMVLFVLDVFFECIRLASKQSERIQHRDQIDLTQLPFILDRIEGVMGFTLNIVDLSDLPPDDRTLKQNIDAVHNDIELVGHKHLPLSRWYYVNKPLQVYITFTRQWTVGQ
jgi:hypothetical protein